MFAQRFTTRGNTDGFECRVNTKVKGNQNAPALAALNDRGFVVVWASGGQDGSGYGIYGQRYLASGNKMGEEIRINTTTALDQTQPAISSFDIGGFVVIWASKNQDGSGQGIFGQAFNSDSSRASGEFRVNTTTIRNQWQPAVATLNDNTFTTAWTWLSADGSLEGIYGQRFNIVTH